MKFFFNIPFFKIKNIIFLLVFSLSVFSSYGVTVYKGEIFKYSDKEFAEDLILDLIETTAQGDSSKNFWELLLSEESLLKKMISDIENSSNFSVGGVFGSENNANRLFKELLLLYKRSYSAKDRSAISSEIPNSVMYQS